MKYSGLAQALSVVYGEEPAKEIITGKYYERVMRANALATSALKTILIEANGDSEDIAIVNKGHDFSGISR